MKVEVESGSEGGGGNEEWKWRVEVKGEVEMKSGSEEWK